MTALENPEIALALQAVNTEVAKLGLSVNPILEPLPEVFEPHPGEHVEVTDSDFDPLKASLNVFSYVCAAHGLKAHLEFQPVDQQTRASGIGTVQPPKPNRWQCFITPCPPNQGCFIIC